MPDIQKVHDVIPAGFREDIGSGSGLIVPEALSRQREVVRQDEHKLLTRAIREVCTQYNFRLVFVCNQCASPQEPFMKRIRTANGFILRCPHRDLVFQPEPPKKGPRR